MRKKGERDGRTDSEGGSEGARERGSEGARKGAREGAREGAMGGGRERDGDLSSEGERTQGSQCVWGGGGAHPEEEPLLTSPVAAGRRDQPHVPLALDAGRDLHMHPP